MLFIKNALQFSAIATRVNRGYKKIFFPNVPKVDFHSTGILRVRAVVLLMLKKRKLVIAPFMLASPLLLFCALVFLALSNSVSV